MSVSADAAAALEGFPWEAYRKCRVCLAASGEPCVALSGQVAGGRPDGVPVTLPRAHAYRARRSGR